MYGKVKYNVVKETIKKTPYKVITYKNSLGKVRTENKYFKPVFEVRYIKLSPIKEVWKLVSKTNKRVVSKVIDSVIKVVKTKTHINQYKHTVINH